MCVLGEIFWINSNFDVVLATLISVTFFVQGQRGEEDERPAVCTLCLQNGGDPRLLQRPDGVLRRHLGNHDLLPHLRDPEEKTGREPAELPKRRTERSVGLPEPDAGSSYVEGLRVVYSLPSR